MTAFQGTLFDSELKINESIVVPVEHYKVDNFHKIGNIPFVVHHFKWAIGQGYTLINNKKEINGVASWELDDNEIELFENMKEGLLKKEEHKYPFLCAVWDSITDYCNLLSVDNAAREYFHHLLKIGDTVKIDMSSLKESFF